MTKNELAEALTCQSDFTKSQALKAVDGLMKCISNALTDGESIYLRGFGTFKLKRCAERQGRDIAHNKIISIPARRVVKFIPSIELKNKLQ